MGGTSNKISYMNSTQVLYCTVQSYNVHFTVRRKTFGSENIQQKFTQRKLLKFEFSFTFDSHCWLRRELFSILSGLRWERSPVTPGDPPAFIYQYLFSVAQ